MMAGIVIAWISDNELGVGSKCLRDIMNKTIVAMGIAMAITLSSTAYAQNGLISHTIFSGKTLSGGTITGSKGKVTKVSTVKDSVDLRGLTTDSSVYVNFNGSSMTITNIAKNKTYLTGTVTNVFSNTFATSGSFGPTFSYMGTLDFTGGTWFTSLRNGMGTLKNNKMWGEFSFSGLSSKPAGAENFTLNANGMAVPEPGEYVAMASLVIGLGGLIIKRRKHKNA